MKVLFFVIVFSLMRTTFAANYDWSSVAYSQWNDDLDDGYLTVMGSINTSLVRWVASSTGDMNIYYDNGVLHVIQYDRKTTPIGDDNVVFVLSMYGELISADTIGTYTALPLCEWDTHERTGGVAIDDPSDFYLGFMIPESKTADGILRYGWYHLSFGDDLNEVSLLDSGVGLYGESVYVGIGVIPEPTSGILVVLGLSVLLMKRKMYII